MVALAQLVVQVVVVQDGMLEQVVQEHQVKVLLEVLVAIT
jgi:hypothetical protein